MEKKKSIGYGGRGWLLIIWIATAFLAYMVIGNYPLNMLADLYGGQQKLSMVYTGASVIGVLIQIFASGALGKMKSIKKFGVIMGVLSVLALLGIMFLPAGLLWTVVYALGTVFSVMYGTFALSILVGQWFPTKKGSVMGISTMAFPIGNGVMGVFKSLVYVEGVAPQVVRGFLPFLIIMLVGLIIGIITVPDYPEQVGAFRDNNPDMTPEIAKQMMIQEMEDKKTTVWTLGRTLTTRDFWFLTIPAGFLLAASVGVMTQTQAIIGSAGLGDKFEMIMGLIMVFGILGSVILGFIDDKFGTKKSMLISCIIMVIAGVLGMMSKTNGTLAMPALFCLAMFMGASSNFTVSLAAQYWRREDFSAVFGRVNPVANLINSFGPAAVGIIMGVTGSYVTIFTMVLILGVISVILVLCFNAKHVKAKDDAYREAAGKPLDDALVGRK